MIYSCVVLALLTASHFVAVAPRGVRRSDVNSHRNNELAKDSVIDTSSLKPVTVNTDTNTAASEVASAPSLTKSKAVRAPKAKKRNISKRSNHTRRWMRVRKARRNLAASASEEGDNEEEEPVKGKGKGARTPPVGKVIRNPRSQGKNAAAGADADASGDADNDADSNEQKQQQRQGGGGGGGRRGGRGGRRDPNSRPARRNKPGSSADGSRDPDAPKAAEGPTKATTNTAAASSSTTSGAFRGRADRGGSMDGLPDRGPKPRRYRTSREPFDDLKPRNYNATQAYHNQFIRVNGTRIHKVNGTVLPDRSRYTRNRTVDRLESVSAAKVTSTTTGTTTRKSNENDSNDERKPLNNDRAQGRDRERKIRNPRNEEN